MKIEIPHHILGFGDHLEPISEELVKRAQLISRIGLACLGLGAVAIASIAVVTVCSTSFISVPVR